MEKDACSTGKRQRLYRVRTLRRTLSLWSYFKRKSIKLTDPEKCILCLRCIAVCPSGAKKLPERVQEMLNQKLLPLKGIRKENELFL